MRALAVLLSLLAMVMTCHGAEAQRRVALVIGNGAYIAIRPLNNPAGDAGAMAALLRGIGFDVMEATDLTLSQMRERLAEFGKKADGADMALLYYAGQGVAASGENYLLAVDAAIKAEADIAPNAVNLNAAIDAMSKAETRLVFYDASRDNPFASKVQKNARTPVRAASLVATRGDEGSLILYAAAPGRAAEDGPKGGHSPFTKALLAHIAEPGVEIQRATLEIRAEVNEETDRRQLPWGLTNLTRELYLNPVAAK
jgi:uncharacterized caspase-like protein